MVFVPVDMQVFSEIWYLQNHVFFAVLVPLSCIKMCCDTLIYDRGFKSNSFSDGGLKSVFTSPVKVITVLLPLRYQQSTESGPPSSTEVDLFISTQRIKVLSAFTQVQNTL